jgi:pimeloyl-ACP methyl ester carboxylesterase
MIRRRHVYHLAGYDPIDAPAQFRRFGWQLQIFQRTWGVEANLAEMQASEESTRASWRVRARASNWQVECVHELLLWDDIVRSDFAQPTSRRLTKGLRAYFDFFSSGTVFKYIVANQRYALFFLFPLFQLAVLAAGAGLLAALVNRIAGVTGSAAMVLGFGVGALVFGGLLKWLGPRWRLQQALDDWIFASDYLYGRRPDVDARLERFAEALVARAATAEVDEIVVVGHSLGATLALEMLVRALARDPVFAKRGPSVSLLTIGATIPKFALHPRAERIRRTIARVVAEPTLHWAEYQSRDDAISFYKFDPVSLKRIDDDRLNGKPVIRRVQIHDMLHAATFARYRRRFLRLHYQSVMANEKQAPYDYFLMVCGPVPFPQWTRSRGGLIDFISPDGAYRGPLPDMNVSQVSVT